MIKVKCRYNVLASIDNSFRRLYLETLTIKTPRDNGLSQKFSKLIGEEK
jgi:hypothetical protein